MPFVKVVKNKAYFKRFQVKYRRRREGKTDYYARQKLIVQAKNKYNTPRYRLCVRSTNKYVSCQIVYSEINCDKVLASAYSSELSRYGLKVGLKNYSAAYCTGLLVARRLLSKLGMGEMYEGNTEIDGSVVGTEFNGRDHFVAEVDEERRPFRAVLDVGLVATSVGNRVFGAMKGASDGGLDIPHNEKCFPGYDSEAKEFTAEVHRDHIFGEHVAEYMRALQTADEENGTEDYARQFSQYTAEGLTADDLEGMYTKVHAAIRADPSAVHADSAKNRRKQEDGSKHNKRYANRSKMSRKQRVDRIRQKKAAAAREE